MTAPDPVTAEVAPALTGGRALLRAPVDGATYRGAAQLAVGWVWLLTVGLTIFLLVVIAASLVPALGIGLLVLPPALVLARWFGEAERARLAAQTGVVIDTPQQRRPTGGWWSRIWAQITDPAGWGATLYALAALLLVSLSLAVSFTLAGGAVAAITLMAVPPSSATLPVAVLVPGAVLLIWLAAGAVQIGAVLTVELGRVLLGPSAAARARAAQRAAEAEARAAETTAATARQRAEVLTETRAAALEAADAERRRIERDLHDGAQQRLVALGVALGSARRAADRDPAVAVTAVEHAHTEVKETLAELRDLVRGIHPAVLADRGLDAALSALAARSPVPVRVEAGDGLEAAGTTAQAAAYFVVAEALTNVARHAEADHVWVRAVVVPADDGAAPRLRVEVSDDGRGGAEARSGSGLAGLRGRVVALDGEFDLTSPLGAGTRLAVEVPCVS